MARIKVLVVDDSAVVRSFVQQVVNSDPDMQIVAWAPDPFVARQKIIDHQPDVMVLDVEMPRMDGISFLAKVMQHKPTKTLIFSSLTLANSPLVLKAFEAGAVDVMAKPDTNVSTGLAAIANELVTRIKAVASAKLPTPRVLDRAALPRTATKALDKTTHRLIAIASSTGGTEALKDVLPLFPADIPGIVIVQHMPPVFTKAFASSLQKLCPFEVREAVDGDKVIPGRALLAPGNFHMELQRRGGYYHVVLHQQPLMHGVRPAADFLFKTVAMHAGSNALGIILTGMGKDGAEGLKAMRDAGAWTIAQNEQTCVVYGMPKVAIEIGAACEILPLESIAAAALKKLENA